MTSCGFDSFKGRNNLNWETKNLASNILSDQAFKISRKNAKMFVLILQTFLRKENSARTIYSVVAAIINRTKNLWNCLMWELSIRSCIYIIMNNFSSSTLIKVWWRVFDLPYIYLSVRPYVRQYQVRIRSEESLTVRDGQ